MTAGDVPLRAYRGCAIGVTLTGALVALYFTALPPQTWVATESPVIAGWIAMLFACKASRRLRAAVASGAMPQGAAMGKSLPFLFIFPAIVGVASGVGLAISHAAGLGLSHMSFLLPYAAAFWGLLVAGAACVAHILMVGNTRTAA